jgi:hypothetical protein
VKPFQLFLRDVVAPALSDLGFKGRGGTYRYIRNGGYQATFFFHQFRLGHKQLEFLVDEAVLVPEWHAFVRETRDFDEVGVNLGAPSVPFERAEVSTGPVERRMVDPDVRLGLPWQFDLDDTEASDRFVNRLVKRAEEFVELTDPSVFEDKLRRRDPELRRHMRMPEEVSLAIIFADQGRFAEADEVLTATADWFRAEALRAWVEARRVAAEQGVRESER